MYDSLQGLPRSSGPTFWDKEGANSEELCCLWESFYAEPYEKAQDLQQKLLVGIRKAERHEEVGKKDRTNRLKALGNAIVPHVAAEIMKAIRDSDNIGGEAC
jgi:hypothetical protein